MNKPPGVPPAPSKVGSSTGPSDPPVKNGGEAYGAAGATGGNGLLSAAVGEPAAAPQSRKFESELSTVTTKEGSAELIDKLKKLSTTDSEPSLFSDTTFRLKRVLVASPACGVAPIARRLPQSPGFSQ